MKVGSTECFKFTADAYTKTSNGTDPGEKGQSESAQIGTISSAGDILETIITVSGDRPVMIGLRNDNPTTALGSLLLQKSGTGSLLAPSMNINFYRGATLIESGRVKYTVNLDASSTVDELNITLPAFMFRIIDFPSAGTYTYKMNITSGDTIQVENFGLYAFEL